jgi:hypothetical protein
MPHLELRWPLVAAAVALDLAAYGCQAARWTLLLRRTGRVPWMMSAQAIYAGLFANELLPMRPGEVLRAWIVARAIGAPVAAIAPSIIVERLCDALLIVAGVGLTALVVPVPSAALRTAAWIAVMLAVVVAIPIAFGRKRRTSTHMSIVSGVRSISFTRSTWAALFVSILILAAQVAAFWLVMLADGIRLPVWDAAAVLSLVHLGTAVPGPPANVGTYQVSTILALTLFGVSVPAATAFSVVVFAVLTVPLWVMGGVAFARTWWQIGAERQIAARPRARINVFRAPGAALALLVSRVTEVLNDEQQSLTSSGADRVGDRPHQRRSRERAALGSGHVHDVVPVRRRWEDAARGPLHGDADAVGPVDSPNLERTDRGHGADRERSAEGPAAAG